MTAGRLIPWVAACVWVLGGVEEAAAQSVPAWCGGKTFDAKALDLQDLKRSEPDYVLGAIVTTLCSTSDEIAQHRGKIEQARQAWGKKLAMNDADWGDMVAYKEGGDAYSMQLSTKNVAQMTPLDQYVLLADNTGELSNHLYVGDMFGDKLTEVGRLALIRRCLKERVEHDSVGEHAVCQADYDAFDVAKFGAQLRTDKAHKPASRMLLRLTMLAVLGDLKEYTAERDKLFAKDETYKKVFETATKARKAWAEGIGKDQALLELVLTMESASFSGSRKLFGDCQKPTADALAKAVAKIPAKTFEGMADERMDPFKGFAHKAGPVLVANPEVNLAATAYVLCDPKTHTSAWLAGVLGEIPGYRGPRAAATGEILSTKFEYDDVNARPLPVPALGGRTFSKFQGADHSAGGVVGKVTPGKEHAVVALKKTVVKKHQCLQVKYTNRVTRVRSDGSLEYEANCVKSGVVAVDNTWADFKIRNEFVPVLKPGVMFSAVGANTAMDVVAIWPSGGAKAPSWLLGAKLK